MLDPSTMATMVMMNSQRKATPKASWVLVQPGLPPPPLL